MSSPPPPQKISLKAGPALPAEAFMSPPLVPVHATTVEYAKKLIDEMTSSHGKPVARRHVPKVPSFFDDELNRKMPAQELFGDTDTDAVSETDWEKKQCSSSEGEMSGGVDEAEDVYSEPDHHSDSGDSSGSNYESGSSFEDAAKKKTGKEEKSPPNGQETNCRECNLKTSCSCEKENAPSCASTSISRQSTITVYEREV